MNDKEIHVSIIMPAYNSGKYIRDAIHSVIMQSYTHWELIIVDDCSKDDTANIVKTFMEQDARIQLYTNEHNQGVSYSRNRAISQAKGRWIAFLDSDDMWRDDKLEKQIIFAERQKAEFIYTASAFIDEQGQSYDGVFNVPTVVSFKELKTHNVISCSSVLIKKAFFNTIRMENDSMHEDYAVWLRVLQTGIQAYGINEPLLIYRISKNSKSGNKMKTIKMTYRVYRFVGINKISSVYCLVRHLMGSLKKYKGIKKVKSL